MRPDALLPALLAIAALAGCGGNGSFRIHAAAPPATARHRTTHRPEPAPVPLESAAASRRAHVPILMYHVVSAPKPGAPNTELYVDRRRFDDEVGALLRAGYHGVTLDDVWAAWHGAGRLPRHPVVLTFDDGYLSDYTHAAPALRAAGWPGVLDLELADVRATGGLSAHMVRRMIRQGWEVASHTMTHPDLTTIDAARLRAELVDSRARIRVLFGRTPRFFCYPAGRFDARAEAAVRAAGYVGATTELPGAAAPTGDPYALPRIRVNGSDTPAMVLARVRAALRA